MSKKWVFILVLAVSNIFSAGVAVATFFCVIYYDLVPILVMQSDQLAINDQPVTDYKLVADQPEDDTDLDDDFDVIPGGALPSDQLAKDDNRNQKMVLKRLKDPPPGTYWKCDGKKGLRINGVNYTVYWFIPAPKEKPNHERITTANAADGH